MTNNLQNTSKALLELSDRERKGIGAMMFQVSKLLGTETPDGREQMPIIEGFIVRHFGDLTIQEVGTAFELYCARKLNTKAEHYGKLNLKFIGEILNAYKEKKRERIVSVPLLEAPTPSAEERENEAYCYLIRYMKKIGGVPEYYDWASCYGYLERKGIIQLTKEEKRTVKNIVRAETRERLAKYNPFLAAVAHRFRDPQYERYACRAKAFKTWLQAQIDQLTLEKFLENEITSHSIC